MNIELALQLDNLLTLSYKKLPIELKELQPKIHERLDLPVSNLNHKFNEQETEEMVKWLKTKPVKNSNQLIEYIEKVHKFGDV